MRIPVVAALVVSAAVAAAQDKACTTQGPGVAFGITGYTCASCSVQRSGDSLPSYTFDTEPVVSSVSSTSPFWPGDVIVSVNGVPITTRKAAQDFATPTPGRHTVYFRRWDGNTLWAITAQVAVAGNCRLASVPRVQQRRVAALAAGSDQPPLSRAVVSPDPTSRVGFAVTCTPACTQIRDKEGRLFWKHEGYPAIVAVRKDSPASDAGLQIGDLIAEVNGVAVVDEAGSRILQSYSRTPLTSAECIKCEVPFLKMQLIRDGERREVTLYLQERRP